MGDELEPKRRQENLLEGIEEDLEPQEDFEGITIEEDDSVNSIEETLEIKDFEKALDISIALSDFPVKEENYIDEIKNYYEPYFNYDRINNSGNYGKDNDYTSKLQIADYMQEGGNFIGEKSFTDYEEFELVERLWKTGSFSLAGN